MDKIFEQVLLYDFYGELLTPHQRSIYEAAVFHDMSLGEIAKEQGISRQGVHDLIKRCDKILLDYEGKLHLVERFSCAKEKIREIVELAEDVEILSGQAEDAGAAADGKDGRGQAEKACHPEPGARMRRIRELSLELMNEW